ncbi:phosphopentomutase [bacterium]|nr:phosphopentomutase [candidate division CSSED10-310 bacterium]
MERCDQRFVIIVLDGVGIGAAPDADRFGDAGAHTLRSVCLRNPGIRIPTLQRLGLGNITPLPGVPPSPAPLGAYGKMREQSGAKDTSVGHWEIAGLVSPRGFPVYPGGFPEALVKAFEAAVGCGTLGNKAASGTEIIEELGEAHMRTGRLIIYTSADSVFQIAAHEEIVPLDKLYEICRIARRMLVGEHAVGRVIARPFIGSPGGFTRTGNRRDFSLPPHGPTLLDVMRNAGHDVIAVGKIEDIFGGRGITRAEHTTNNTDGMLVTNRLLEENFDGLLFVNLVDFDMLFGHRNDPVGFGGALEQVDVALAETLRLLKPRDILVITADHGCDPLFPTTDHTREYVPLLACGARIPVGTDLGCRTSFADISATALHYFNLDGLGAGVSFLTAAAAPPPPPTHGLADNGRKP